MNQVRQAFGDSFEAIEGALCASDVRDAYVAATARLGFAYTALFPLFDTDPADLPQGSVLFLSMPEGWNEYYSDQRYYTVDPVQAAAAKLAGPFSWRSPAYRRGLTKRQKELLDDATAAGLGAGLAFPIRSTGAPAACCTLIPAEGDFDPKNYGVAHALAVFAHERARLVQGTEFDSTDSLLSRRERECLLLAARGKSDWAIGELLNLSERTVHHAIERAKRRLGVATRVQAIVRAIHHGAFSAADAIE